jgi:hypothetical protein
MGDAWVSQQAVNSDVFTSVTSKGLAVMPCVGVTFNPLRNHTWWYDQGRLGVAQPGLQNRVLRFNSGRGLHLSH